MRQSTVKGFDRAMSEASRTVIVTTGQFTHGVSAGVDLVDVQRLGRAVDTCGPALMHRLFDADERAACADGAEETATAVLFGIKESVIKVIGGMPPGGRFRDIRIGLGAQGPDQDARLLVRLEGELARWSGRDDGALVAGSLPYADDLVVSWALATTPDASSPDTDLEAPC